MGGEDVGAGKAQLKALESGLRVQCPARQVFVAAALLTLVLLLLVGAGASADRLLGPALAFASSEAPAALRRPATSLPALSAFVRPESWCTANPYLSTWGPEDFLAAAESLLQFRSTQNTVALDGPAWRHPGHLRFNATPLPVRCAPLGRYPLVDAPGEPDGGKWLCALDSLRPGCVIYSIGSNGEFSFEYDMVLSTPCEIHTFDCTVEPKDLPADLDRRGAGRVHFHPWCVGLPGGQSGPNFYSWEELTAKLGHAQVDLKKIDTEGAEFRVFETLFANALRGRSLSLLPMQISMEVHAFSPWVPSAAALNSHEHGGGMSAGDMQVLWTQLVEMGYAVVSRDDNKRWGGGSEFTLVRAFC